MGDEAASFSGSIGTPRRVWRDMYRRQTPDVNEMLNANVTATVSEADSPGLGVMFAIDSTPLVRRGFRSVRGRSFRSVYTQTPGSIEQILRDYMDAGVIEEGRASHTPIATAPRADGMVRIRFRNETEGANETDFDFTDFHDQLPRSPSPEVESISLSVSDPIPEESEGEISELEQSDAESVVPARSGRREPSAEIEEIENQLLDGESPVPDGNRYRVVDRLAAYNEERERVKEGYRHLTIGELRAKLVSKSRRAKRACEHIHDLEEAVLFLRASRRYLKKIEVKEAVLEELIESHERLRRRQIGLSNYNIGASSDNITTHTAWNPQHALPDVFLWLVSNGKRYAYQRIPAKDLIFSMVDEENGKHSGKVHTIFLKLPGKKSVGSSGWMIQSKLDIYFWLGLLKHKQYVMNGLPKGYEISNEIRNIERPYALPPLKIHYVEKYTFQFRANVYQARSLIGSDASGLSDPFARVIIGENMRVTQVIDETLSPTWDELLIIDNILLYGTQEDIKKDPPAIVIEIFDQDKVGKSEFLGRTIAKPHVKLASEAYTKPNFPPSLEWYDIHRGSEHAGELLATFELLQVSAGLGSDLPEVPPSKDVFIISPSGLQNTGPILPVPKGIRPTLANYRIEVLFWGLRDLKRVHLMAVDRPRVDIECAGNILYSSVIQNAKKNPNFSPQVKFLDLELPEEELYRPPLTIRAVDCRSFGRFTLVGTHMINSVQKYMYIPTTRTELAEERAKNLKNISNGYCVYENNAADVPFTKDFYPETFGSTNEVVIKIDWELSSDNKFNNKKSNRHRKRSAEASIDEDDDEENNDWWTKYFASLESAAEEEDEAIKVKYLQDQTYTNQRLENGDCDVKGSKTKISTSKFHQKLSPKIGHRKKRRKIAKFKIYTKELELQTEFNGFREWLLPFELYRGKKSEEESEDESRVVGIFKGSIKVYKKPLPKDIVDHTIMGFDPQYGLFQGVPSNEPIHVLVRVYIVKANDLHPTDMNGKADPYIVLQLGSKRISDKDNYISKQLNPVFGKFFEIEATFPQDSMLTVQVLDWDLVGSDDLIGETRIDLENRFYSRHRAICGLPEKYETTGYNRWRDPLKPSQILAKLCKDAKIDPPTYLNGTVRIDRKLFRIETLDENKEWYRTKGAEEHMALAVLHHWQEIPRIGCVLLPEHIETRPLYKPDKIGIERGKLEMWVDMFPMDMPLPGPPIDISPRKPKSYELRVIIWNTDDVVLEDDAFFTGEKMSDIYVKGWLKGPEDCQSTDIHYRSLTGEGNFNWRFIFPFNYLMAEGKIVTSRKESLFSWDESESKIPARLELQVWDADHFSADDFLGALTLDLNRFPRGAKSSKLCTLSMLKNDASVPMVNIFKQKRVKGWWPFYVKKENEEMELTGKVEAELHLLTQEEAERNPAGQGRSEPDPLDKPNRPDSSFMWFMNPIKSIRYIIWHNYKWTILKIVIILCLAILILLFVYSIPGYTVKRLLGA
ncbi:hypothetical protein V9T40_005116 [Parthenolecanium corni]|uniref:C2 domain-containing protein n=1 Tax=Parthenolecanium corni TaxID=536013 RepID=A0AAN9THL3_9HEMI